MRELYRFSGPYWSLPAWIEYSCGHEQVARVNIGAGVHLLEIQHTVARGRLEAIGAFRGQGRWWLHGNSVRQFFQRCEDQDMDPELLVEWRPWHRTVAYRQERRKTAVDDTREADEFFHEFAKLGWINDPVQAQAIWQVFCKHAMHWLVNEGRPVDFVFFKLHALPLRKNWKEMLLGSSLWMRRRRAKARFIMRSMLDSRLTGYDPEAKAVSWTLDAMAKPVWDQFTRDYEAARRRARKSEQSRYTKHVFDSIKLKLGEMGGLYADYLSRIQQSYLELGPEPVADAAASPIATKRTGNHYRMRNAPGQLTAFVHWHRRKLRQVEPEISGGEGEALPEVPSVRLPAGYLRASRRVDRDARR